MKAIPYKFLFCTEQFFWSFFPMIQLKNTSLRRPQWNGFLLTICWFIAKLAHPLYLTTDNETRHYMQFSLKSSLCRFIRKSFVGIFKMNTDSCFRHPRDGTSCHRTLEDLASWTRRPRFSGLCCLSLAPLILQPGQSGPLDLLYLRHRPFWQKNLCWAFFWRKIIFLSPLLSQTAFLSTFF